LIKESNFTRLEIVERLKISFKKKEKKEISLIYFRRHLPNCGKLFKKIIFSRYCKLKENFCEQGGVMNYRIVKTLEK